MPRPQSHDPRLVGVDTGGTFTDLVGRDAAGALHLAKVPSTPDDPARAVLAGLTELDATAGGALDGAPLVHGSTVGLNALLTGRHAPVAWVTNAGFRDLVEIGRQDRPDLYALHPVKPEALVPRERRFEVAQRSWPDASGQVVEVERPTDADLDRLARQVARSGVRSVAVCLLHAYADPGPERRVAEALRAHGLEVTASAELLAAHREVERGSTALVNAALVPVMADYLAGLERALGARRLSILQSSGGTLPAAEAAREPARVILSGPAGGVVGAARAAAEAGLGSVVTLDMGGTSTDVAFHDPGRGLAGATRAARVAGHPVALPTLDVHTVGCGGGSIARVDAGGVLRIGPESAGADPGPVAYGRGDVPTVTDAHVHLGHLSPGGFLGGALDLDVDAVARAFEHLGRTLGVDGTRAASAVLEVARASMRRALGVHTMQRGHDPARLSLVAFGGGGGLHAAALAGALGMPGALVPARPGVLSAWGMLHADALRDRTLAVLEPLASWGPRARGAAFAELERAGVADLVAEGHRRRDVVHERVLELRYRGQSHELALPCPPGPGAPDPAEAFREEHHRRYGWDLPAGEVELVGLRCRSRVPAPPPQAGGPAPRARRAPAGAVAGEAPLRMAGLEGGPRVPRYRREALSPGHRVVGPAVIEEFSATTLIPPGWAAQVRPGGHLWLQNTGSGRS